MMPLAGPRSLIGPMIVLNGSFPKPLKRNRFISCGPGVSAAIAACTASLTSAGFIATSSGRLCCQSNRSGKYGGRRTLSDDGDRHERKHDADTGNSTLHGKLLDGQAV